MYNRKKSIKKPPSLSKGTRVTRVATLVNAKAICILLKQLTPAKRLYLLPFNIDPPERLSLGCHAKCFQPKASCLYTRKY